MQIIIDFGWLSGCDEQPARARVLRGPRRVAIKTPSRRTAELPYTPYVNRDKKIGKAIPASARCGFCREAQWLRCARSSVAKALWTLRCTWSNTKDSGVW